MMRILIGGSASTGSSLLKNILSRHPDIFSGGETSLFTKKELFLDFNANKSRINRRFPLGLRSHSYHMYNGVDLLRQEYGWTEKEISKIINQANSFHEFADLFFDKGINQYNKKHWIEKTPANAYLFKEFLDAFPESWVIHITRHPRNAIYSMIRRGYNLLEACGIYLLNTAAGMRCSGDAKYYQIKYEDLIASPEESIASLMNHLDLNFMPQMLDEGNPYNIEETKIQSWRHDETAVIKPSEMSIPQHTLQSINEAIEVLKVTDEGMSLYSLNINGYEELLTMIGYEYEHQPGSIATKKLLKSQMQRDKWKRMKKFYKSGFHYPLRIDK